MDSECHLFILWEKARYQEDKILSDIRQHFSIIKLYEIVWSKEYVSDNFTRFYGTNLPHNSMKEIHCGTGPFLLIIVKDNNPIYEKRLTSHGNDIVNINMFDAKSKYRLWTGGGHKVHATNNPIEFDHDLVMLLGVNRDDFLEICQKDNTNIERIKKDIVGAKGWDSLAKVFYVLNSTINYVILRGKEELISGYFSEEHRDIDIFVEDFQSAKYIINGISSCSIARPHEMIVINGYEYYLDLWVLTRNYFDFNWAKKMLSDRVFENGYYVLAKEDELYSLLYHTLIIKGIIADDYQKKLEILKKKCECFPDLNNNLLTNFLQKNSYDITYPSDLSITIHLENPIIHNYAFRHGKLISTNYQDEKTNVPYFSVVYEKEGSYYKRGSDFLIDNETRFLRELENYNCFPKLLCTGVGEDGPFLETEKIKGDNFETFFSLKKHLKIKYIRSFIQESIKILRILSEHGIVHRDFMGQNLIIQESVNGCKVYLIDFGWAIYKKEYNICLRPSGLGYRYAPEKGFSDLYTFAMTIKEIWPNIHFVSNIRSMLQTLIFCGEDDTDECFKVLGKVEMELNKRIGIKDSYRLLEKRHPHFLKVRIRFVGIIRKVKKLFL